MSAPLEESDYAVCRFVIECPGNAGSDGLSIGMEPRRSYSYSERNDIGRRNSSSIRDARYRWQLVRKLDEL